MKSQIIQLFDLFRPVGYTNKDMLIIQKIKLSIHSFKKKPFKNLTRELH